MYESMPEIRDLPGCQSQMAEFDDSATAVYHACIGTIGHDFGCVCRCGRRWSLFAHESTDREPS